MAHAGVYAAALHYLKAVEAVKDKDSAKVMAKMKELPTDDPLFGKGSIRPDGRKIHDMHLFEVRSPLIRRVHGISINTSPRFLPTKRSVLSPRAAVPW